MEKIITNSAEETQDFAFDYARNLSKGAVIELIGDLGAGKTAFAKGFAKGLGIEQAITSPTFSLLNTYNGRLKLNHFDLYRIEDLEELYMLGFEEQFLDENAVNLIEWPQIAYDMLPKNRVRITITKLNENQREIKVENL